MFHRRSHPPAEPDARGRGNAAPPPIPGTSGFVSVHTMVHASAKVLAFALHRDAAGNVRPIEPAPPCAVCGGDRAPRPVRDRSAEGPRPDRRGFARRASGAPSRGRAAPPPQGAAWAPIVDRVADSRGAGRSRRGPAQGGAARGVRIGGVAALVGGRSGGQGRGAGARRLPADAQPRFPARAAPAAGGHPLRAAFEMTPPARRQRRAECPRADGSRRRRACGAPGRPDT